MGASRKTVHVLDQAVQLDKPITYWPFDVCEPIMLEAAARLVERYANQGSCKIQPLVGDYNQALSDIPAMQGSRLFLFLGGTLGNFTPAQASAFLSAVETRDG